MHYKIVNNKTGITVYEGRVTYERGCHFIKLKRDDNLNKEDDYSLFSVPDEDDYICSCCNQKLPDDMMPDMNERKIHNFKMLSIWKCENENYYDVVFGV